MASLSPPPLNFILYIIWVLWVLLLHWFLSSFMTFGHLICPFNYLLNQIVLGLWICLIVCNICMLDPPVDLSFFFVNGVPYNTDPDMEPQFHMIVILYLLLSFLFQLLPNVADIPCDLFFACKSVWPWHFWVHVQPIWVKQVSTRAATANRGKEPMHHHVIT